MQSPTVKAVHAPQSLRLSEDRLDDLLAAPIEGRALRCGEEHLDPPGLRALPASQLSGCGAPHVGGRHEDLDPAGTELGDGRRVPVAAVGHNGADPFLDTRRGDLGGGRGDHRLELAGVVVCPG